MMKQVTSSGQTITVVHFTYKAADGWRIACLPYMDSLDKNRPANIASYQRSNDTRAVNCPACKASQAFAIGG